MRYMTGCTNYATHVDAERAFERLARDIVPVVLEKHKDGSAVIVFLTDKPVQPGQVAYVGSGQ